MYNQHRNTKERGYGMRLKKETRKKLFKLFQMLIGMVLIKLIDYFLHGNTVGIIVNLLITIYVLYLAITLLYGKSAACEEEDEQ